MTEAQDAVTKFVIMSDSRSGTSLLSETLYSHPEILCHGEVFHPNPVHHLRGTLKPLSVEEIKRRREEDPARFIDEVFDQPNYGAVGFKMWRAQNPEYCDRLLADPSVLKIIYERENVLARYSSSRLVKATGVYNMTPSGKRSQALEKLVSFDAGSFRSYLERHRELFEHYRAKARGRVLDLTYSDLVRNGFSEVLTFLGVEDIPLSPQKARLHSSDILSRFEPDAQDTIFRTLNEIGRPEWRTE